MCVFGAIRGLYRECTVIDRFWGIVAIGARSRTAIVVRNRVSVDRFGARSVLGGTWAGGGVSVTRPADAMGLSGGFGGCDVFGGFGFDEVA